MNRRHRLRGRAAFRGVRSMRASSSTAGLRVSVAPNGSPLARVGFAVPRSSGGSVERNRIRRRLRAALRPRLDSLAGLDVVVGARAAVAVMPWPELTGEVERCTAAARARLGRSRGGRG